MTRAVPDFRKAVFPPTLKNGMKIVRQHSQDSFELETNAGAAGIPFYLQEVYL